MKSNPGVAATVFETLAADGINIEMISTSAIRISLRGRRGRGRARPCRSLHDAFGLGRRPPPRRLRPRSRPLTPGIRCGRAGARRYPGRPCASGSSAPPARSAASCAPSWPSGSSPSTSCASSPRPARPAAPCRGRTARSGRGRRHRRLRRASTSSCSPPAGPPRKELAPRVAAAGAVVVDNSSAWRMDPDVPLVVPEVNAHALDATAQGHRRQPQLHDDGRPCRCSSRSTARPACAPGRVSTYQAVSGGGPGRRRPSSTSRSARSVDGPPRSPSTARAVDFPQPQKFPAPIAFNVIPHGRLDRRRRPRARPTRSRSSATRPARSSSIPDLPVSGTCVRVPVFTGHSLSINAALRPADHARTRPAEILDHGPRRRAGRRAHAAAGRRRRPHLRRPHPRRPDASSNGLALFVSGDNLRKGAALNAVQIAELVAAEA